MRTYAGLIIVLCLVLMVATLTISEWCCRAPVPVAIPEPRDEPQPPIKEMYSKDGCWVRQVLRGSYYEGMAVWHPLRRCHAQIFPLKDDPLR